MHTIITAQPLHMPDIEVLLNNGNLPIQDINDPSITFKIDKNINGVIGYQKFTNSALLRSLMVKTEAQNRGIAQKLINSALNELKSLNIAYVYLLTTTAHTYFSRHGFYTTSREEAPLEITTTAQFRSICPDSAHFMSKPL
ncbi:MAG: arsenic resistance N-acetyltransferase ArsN2 [Fibrobacterales bacterium]